MEAGVIRREVVQGTPFDDIPPGPALPPLTPGDVLLEEFMCPLRLTARASAAELGLGNLIPSIVNGSRMMTAETALLLARRSGNSAELRMNLHMVHDPAVAQGDVIV
jgi:addiction module HigA family antidote